MSGFTNPDLSLNNKVQLLKSLKELKEISKDLIQIDKVRELLADIGISTYSVGDIDTYLMYYDTLVNPKKYR